MIEKFLKYIAEENLCKDNQRILLAVSGGMDSMLMAGLFNKSEFDFGIAHCNFGLRGQESDEDELFVKDHAGKAGTPFYTKRFETAEYAREHKLSIQMAARELRYQWFEEIRQREGYQAIALAHHLNDLVETMLINLVRGTGVKGMHGILPKNGKLIRPLLCFTREEITAYVTLQDIPYREESSNSSDKYTRNRIRHQVIPALKALNPSLEHTFESAARHFSEAAQLVREQANRHRHLMKKQGETWTLDHRSLKQVSAPRTIAYELLSPFGFNAATVNALLDAAEAQPGKQFFSASHRAVKDRDQFIITPLHVITPLHEEPLPRFEDLFEARTAPAQGINIHPDPAIAFLDYDTLRLPLKVRYWQDGDNFHPLGMKGHKKLSDFFVDCKVPLHLKRRIPLLVSGSEIAWVAGYRIADPFKVTPVTEKVYEITIKASKNKLNLA